MKWPEYLLFGYSSLYLLHIANCSALSTSVSLPQVTDKAAFGDIFNDTVTDEPNDDFWRHINYAVETVRGPPRYALPKFVRGSFGSDLKPRMYQVVFDTFPEDTFMYMYGEDMKWRGPMHVPSSIIPYPPNLKYFHWSKMHMGLTEVLYILRTAGIADSSKGSYYSRYEVYEEPDPITPQVWYHIMAGQNVPYTSVRINAVTKEVIPGRPSPSSADAISFL